MEITKDNVTALFCIIAEFYKVFDAEILDSCIATAMLSFYQLWRKGGKTSCFCSRSCLFEI